MLPLIPLSPVISPRPPFTVGGAWGLIQTHRTAVTGGNTLKSKLFLNEQLSDPALGDSWWIIPRKSIGYISLSP